MGQAVLFGMDLGWIEAKRYLKAMTYKIYPAIPKVIGIYQLVTDRRKATQQGRLRETLSEGKDFTSYWK